ncbi:MAG: cyclic nucleotide-binding domain-containing protein, partial [bacterium]|nr:cyclic nucleotide-binding domain-containing protein [bacterium]
ELKSLLHPIFEQLRPAQLLDRLDLAFPQSSLDRAGRLAEILRLGGSRINPWLRACAIDALTRLGPSGVPDELVANLFSAHPLVKEMAAWGIHRIDPAALDRHLPRLAEDERTALDPLVRGGPQELLRGWDKVLILRRIPVFAPIPEVALAGFANAVEELHPAAGETIFRQGEVGREMYVIVDGMVRIDIDDVAVAELGEADVVGEIAIVGTGVRNATATAGKPTRLLRLDQALLYDLMADNLEVVPEIVRVVSERSASAGASAPPGTR